MLSALRDVFVKRDPACTGRPLLEDCQGGGVCWAQRDRQRSLCRFSIGQMQVRPGRASLEASPCRGTVAMFEGFSQGIATVEGIDIAYVSAGSGPPVLLLHGFPQSKAMWARVAPRLAKDYTVVCADL